MLERVAGRMQVGQPDRVVLEMNVGASVRLRGYRRGQGRCTLCVGYDLLAVLAEDELEAVIAHEMAHAKLVQRGYRGWLGNAIARMARLAGALIALSGAAKEHGQRFYTAELLARGARFLGRRGSRLFAAYSRQDEFAADRAAAELCGPAPFHRALVKIHVAFQKMRGMGWRDRLVQAEREQRFSEWVRERLTPRDEAERQEREAKARNDARRGEFDTHPSLADRLAALPGGAPAESAAPPASGLLRDPDGLGVQLLAELERLLSEQEQQASQESHQQIRKRYRSRKHSPAQLAAALVILVGGLAAFTALEALWGANQEMDAPVPWLVGSLGVIGAGMLIYRKFPFREQIVLPVPPWSRWQAAMEPEARASGAGESIEPLEAEMKAQLPPSIQRKRAQARYWSVECYRSLEQCDYRRAAVSSRLSLAANPHCLEGALGRGIAAAYYGQTQVAQQMLAWALRSHGLGTSVSWGLGWALAMLGNWADAEAYLLDAAARCPDQATVRSLLGTCQWQLGKVRAAAQSVRRATGLEPGEPRHQILLARILLASGRARAALQELEAVESAVGADFQAMLAAASANLLLGHVEEAARCATLLEQAHPGPRTLLALARAHAEASLPDQAYSLFEQVGARGFYPEALVGLARIEYERQEPEPARAHLLAALDLTREREAGVPGPLEFLEAVARGLIAMGEPVEGCQAWTATLELSLPGTNARLLSLLICAPTLEAAREQVRQIHRALHPDRELADASVTWKPVEPEQQPAGPVAPGIYGHRFE
jgi:Tfp pilus assembly protein PilF